MISVFLKRYANLFNGTLDKNLKISTSKKKSSPKKFYTMKTRKNLTIINGCSNAAIFTITSVFIYYEVEKLHKMLFYINIDFFKFK